MHATLAPTAIKHPCSVCKAEMGWAAPSGVCSTECLNKGQGFTPATPAPTADLAATLVDRILHVQKQYRRETGRKLSYADAFDEVVRRANASEPVDGDAELTREDLEPVACLLAGLGYSPQMIDGALEDIGRCGSAQCSSHIDESDRDEVEALIPEVPADAWKGPGRKGLLWGGMVAR